MRQNRTIWISVLLCHWKFITGTYYIIMRKCRDCVKMLKSEINVRIYVHLCDQYLRHRGIYILYRYTLTDQSVNLEWNSFSPSIGTESAELWRVVKWWHTLTAPQPSLFLSLSKSLVSLFPYLESLTELFMLL